MTPSGALVAKSAALSVALLLAISWLAGCVMQMLFRADVRAATPLTVVGYAYYYGDDPLVRRRLAASVGGTLAASALAAIALALPRRRKFHGDARFANRREIRAAGLMGGSGIILGRIGRRYLLLPGQQGVALAAPPRAGKGAGVVIPNALNWSGSLVCLDLKRENWTMSAGYRAAAGQPCFLFEPFASDGRTSRWNPFFYVSDDPVSRINDLQRIADMLYPDPQNVDPFWSASARSLFLGISLYLFETPKSVLTIGEVLRQGMASDDEGFAQHWKRIIEGRNAHENPLSAECTRAIYDVIDLAPQTASSIRKTFTSRLDLWLNPILDAATSGNDFDLRELRSKQMSIYVGVNPEDLHRLRPVLNLFFQQAIGLQTRELPEHNPALRHQVMMLLDEFTALGRIPIIAESIAYLPGYNVRVVLVIQTPSQLREVYGPELAETMLKSLGVRLMFTPKDFADAREISDELGNRTERVRSLSKPARLFDGAKGQRGRSVTESEQKRPLMLPQEVKELPSNKALVFCEGLRPFVCTRIRYFQDATFKRRLMPPPPRPACLDIKPAPPITRSARPAARPAGEFRDATPADAARLDQLTRADFPADYVPAELQIVDESDVPMDTGVRDEANGFMNSIGRKWED